MVTCVIRYVIDPYKISEFETYAKMWIPLVDKLGGKHMGYFLPHEGATNIALALFTFPSLAAYEDYRRRMRQDDECKAAFAYAERHRFIISDERSFFRPVFA